MGRSSKNSKSPKGGNGGKGGTRTVDPHPSGVARAAVTSEDSISVDEDNEEDPPLVQIKTIWEDSFINRVLSDNKEGWHFLWCDKKFRGINATKALAHVSTTAGKHVKICKAKIKPAFEERYSKMWKASVGRKESKRRAETIIHESVAESQSDATAVLINKKQKKLLFWSVF